MSGVFGIVQKTGVQRSVAPTLERMANTLKLRSWHATRMWVAPEAQSGLGQSNIGIISTDPQPVFSEDQSIAAVLFGEVYNTPALQQELKAKGVICRTESSAELILRLYEDCGLALPGRLQGVFALAIWDQKRSRLLLANDRYGLIPHYYAHFNQRLIFSPLVAGILQDAEFHRSLNLDAVADFMRFQRLLGKKTFFEGLHLLPYGSQLVYQADRDELSVTHYWDFDQIPTWPARANFQDAVEEVDRLMRQSISKLIKGSQRVGVFLSGGLDSRTALGFAALQGPPPPSVTYGHPASTDVQYARQIAKALHSEQHYFPQTDGKWLQDHADIHLSVTEGHTSFIHAHAAITLQPVREIFDVNLTGFNGDQLLGARAIEHSIPVVSAVDEIAFQVQLYQALTRDFSWPGFTEGDEKFLYTDSYYPQMRDRAFHSLRQEIMPFQRYPYDRRLDYFTAIHQGARLSNLNVVYHRAYIETRYPFYDYPLLDFVQSLPVEYRMKDRLYLAVVNRAIPKVTWIPRDTNDQLLTDQTLFRTLHFLGFKVWKRTKKALTPGYATQQLHGDPEDWLRNDLRDWAAGILFDQRTVNRGIFNPAYLRSIYDRHLSGREIWTIGKIAPLITFEMMMRKFFDE